MNTLKSILISCVFLFALTFIGQAQTLVEKAQKKIGILNGLVDSAKSKGISTEKEEMTLQTAEIYLTYANWDELHIKENKELFILVPPYTENASKMADELPGFERNEVIKILDEAIERLTLIIEGKYKRKNSSPIDWSKLHISGNSILQDSRPVFLVDHVWKPDIPEYQKFYGAINQVYLSPGLLINEAGDIKPESLPDVKSVPNNKFSAVFIDNNNIPDWAKEKYENIGAASRHYGKYDVDNPGAKELFQLFFKSTIPKVSKTDNPKIGYMIFNEPSYFTEAGVWNTGEVSAFTIEKFKVWLSQKHKSIETLNSLWKSNFGSFDEVEITIPIDGALQGSAQWFDWMTFNNYRITEWFRFMTSEIRKYDPDALPHIKLMPWLWTRELKDHGMDFENLLRTTGICGCDAMARNSHMLGEHEDWMDEYSFYWVEISMMFDFFRSVQPSQIIFDTETHILSSVRFRDLYLKPDYVRATYWLAHMHGLNASRNWVWGRLDSGEPLFDRLGKHYAGINSQQPAVLNELHATMIDLNAYSEEITAIQQLRKPLRVYYSLPNAITRRDYMKDVTETYETLYFDGIPLGFATDSILELEDPADWEAILIRKTETVTVDEFNAIQSYLKKGGTVIIDTESLQQNEYGVPHKKLSSGNGKLIGVESMTEMNSKALGLLEAKGLMPAVTVTQECESASGKCVWRCIKTNEGSYVLSLVNIGNSDTKIQIGLKGKSNKIMCKDMINGMAVNSVTTLKPNDVLFLEISKN